MAVVEIPKLPPLMVVGQGKYKYVSTYKIAWDKELKQPRRIAGQNKTVGKIIGGGVEGVIEWNDAFLEEHPELKSFTVKRVFKRMQGAKKVFEFVFEPADEMISLTAAFNLLRLNAGATWVLDNVIANSPLTIALERVFEKYGRHKKLLSVAYYMYLTSNSATHLYEDFARKHRLPFQKSLDAAQISRLFSRITPDEIDRFLVKLNELVTEKEKTQAGRVNTYYALDSTSISTYSDGITKAKWGHNKDGDSLKQINLLMLVNQETAMPLYYRSYTGNTPDVSTVRNLISEIIRTGINRRAILVADKGYCSIRNINELILSELGFVINCRNTYTFAKQIIAENYSALEDYCSYNSKIQCYCLTTKCEWSYPTYDKTPTGRAVKARTSLYLHLYLDKNIRAECENTLLKRTIMPVLEKLRANIPLNQEENSIRENFLKDNGNGNYSTNHIKKAEFLLTKGIRILISNDVDDAVEAWRAYYERERVEDVFKVVKQNVGGSRFRTAKNESTEGKAFVMFLSCAVGMMFRQRVNLACKKGMQLPYDSDNKLLAMLDSIEQTVFRNGAYYSEVTGVQKELLNALDIPLPTPEPYGKVGKEEEDVDEDDDIRSLDELEIVLNKIESQSK